MTPIILLIILIFINGFFAATEIAFISLNDAKIDMMAKEENKKAKLIKKMLENPSKFLATIQIGITLAGFLSSAFASESFAGNMALALFEKYPGLSFVTWNNISIVVITLLLSLLTLVFGELVPKRIGMKYSEKIAFASSGIIKFISIITAPFVKILTTLTNLISKMFGVSSQDEETVTEEEIRMMVDVGEEKGSIKKEEKSMINNVFELNDKVASEVMIPRTDIYALDMNLTVQEAIEELTEDTRYSRVPIYDETIDNIKGIVYIKDILLSNKRKNSKISTLAKEAFYVPETKPINEVFDVLRRNRKQIAIVTDEYGGTSGIITIEDILEEIVGEIYDEYDVVKKHFEKIDDLNYILSGSVPIYEAEEILGITIPEGDYDTVSGFMIAHLGRVPKENDKGIVETEEAVFKIKEVKHRAVEKVLATIKENNKVEEE